MYLTNIAAKNVAASVAKASSVLDISYAKVNFDMLSRDTRISDIQVSPKGTKEKITIREVILKDVDTASATPEYLAVAAKGIEVDVASMGDMADSLKKLGYTDKMVYDLAVDYRYNPQKQELTINKLWIAAKDVCRIDLTLHLGNLKFDPNQALGLLFSYPGITVQAGEITYRDGSLVQRIMDAEAKEAHQDIREYKTTLIQGIEEGIADKDDASVKKILADIEKFINNPKEITLSVSPSKPQSLGSIMQGNDLKEIIQLLNLRVSAS